MSDISMPFMAGIVFGVLFVLVYLLIAKRKAAQYDERQKAIQGVAYKLGFFTLIIASLGGSSMFIGAQLEKLYIDPFTMEFSAVCLSVLVFAGYSIFKDAYMGINQKPVSTIIVLAIIAVSNLYQAFITTQAIEKNNPYLINLFCGITLTIVIIMLVIKQIINKYQNKKEEE